MLLVEEESWVWTDSIVIPIRWEHTETKYEVMLIEVRERIAEGDRSEQCVAQSLEHAYYPARSDRDLGPADSSDRIAPFNPLSPN